MARGAFDSEVSSDGLSGQTDLLPAWYTSPIGADQTYRLHVTDSGPLTVFGTVVATNPTGPGFITAYGCADGRPLASNLNFSTGQTVADLAAIHTDAAGDICFYTPTATDSSGTSPPKPPPSPPTTPPASSTPDCRLDGSRPNPARASADPMLTPPDCHPRRR